MKINVTHIQQVDTFLPLYVKEKAYRSLDNKIHLFWRPF